MTRANWQNWHVSRVPATHADSQAKPQFSSPLAGKPIAPPRQSACQPPTYRPNPFPIGFARLYDFTLPFILSRIPRGSRILEVGIGNGDLALEICVRCEPIELVGIDIEPRCAFTASEKLEGYRGAILVKDAESSDLFETLGRFDIIVCRITFHHL